MKDPLCFVDPWSMSITYIYNSSTINLFTTEDLGSITATPVSEDYGSITAAHTQAETYSEVQYTADAYPFGTATIGGSADTIQQRVYTYGVTGGFQVTAQTQILLIHAWTGSGSLFEIGGGLERIVAPYLGADPETTTLFTVSGTVGESFATLYNIEDTTTLSTEDFGSVAVGGSLSIMDRSASLQRKSKFMELLAMYSQFHMKELLVLLVLRRNPSLSLDM